MISYVRFSLIGVDCEAFLSFLQNSGFKISALENKGGVLYGNVKPSDYIRISKYARKRRLRLRIEEKRGILFRLLPYRKRIGIPLGAVVFAALICFFSGKIWDIDISGNEKLGDEQILELLEDCGIYAGADSGSFVGAAAEVKAMLKLEELAWISIENQGSRVFVKINERLTPEQAVIPLSAPCNVTAARAGVIVSAEVYRGRLLFPVGSAVARDDIVVSGTVDDGAGHVMQNHASAKIIAEFNEEVEFYQLYSTTETVKTGVVETADYIELFSFVYPSQRQYPKNSFVYRTETRLVTVFGLEMPWKIRRVIGEQTGQVAVTRSAEDVKRTLERQLERYCENFFSGAEIVSIDRSYLDDGEGIRLYATITARENIAVQKEIHIS